MGDDIGEECGVCGVFLKDWSEDRSTVSRALITMNLAQQHRGQKSSGIVVYNPLRNEEFARRPTMVGHKGTGMVYDVFRLGIKSQREEIVRKCAGVSGVGHVRYSTQGMGREDGAGLEAAIDCEGQPFMRRHFRPEKRMAISYNGHMANYPELAQRMIQEGYNLETNVDTEIWMSLLSLEIKRHSTLDSDDPSKFTKPDVLRVIGDAAKYVDGAANLAVLFGDGRLAFYRNGFRPLVWGENELFYAVASESLALSAVGISKWVDVMPGQGGVFDGG